MLTIGRLARRAGLSRATLLYYDRLGLLSPSERSGSGYRLYGADDAARLERILALRRAGLPLMEIKTLLESEEQGLAAALSARLMELDGQIEALREQQRFICALLGREGTRTPVDKAGWTALLAEAGFSEEDMLRWHRAFERTAPESHEAFLRALGIDKAERARIRAW